MQGAGLRVHWVGVWSLGYKVQHKDCAQITCSRSKTDKPEEPSKLYKPSKPSKTSALNPQPSTLNSKIHAQTRVWGLGSRGSGFRVEGFGSSWFGADGVQGFADYHVPQEIKQPFTISLSRG